MSFEASLCDTDTKYGIRFFRVFFSIFVTFLLNVCAHIDCYLVQAYTNTHCKSEIHL